MQLILYAVYKDWKKDNTVTSSSPVKKGGKEGAAMNAMEMGTYGQTNADNPSQKYVNGFESH